VRRRCRELEIKEKLLSKVQGKKKKAMALSLSLGAREPVIEAL
jgi:hypothetical protein